MGIETIVLIALVLVIGYVVYRVIKKIIVALFAMLMVIVLLFVGLGFLLAKDIQTFRSHPTKRLLILLVSEDEQKLLCGATLTPDFDLTTSQNGGSEDDSGRTTDTAADFSLLDGELLNNIHTQYKSGEFGLLLEQYFKVLIMKPSCIESIIQNDATVFDLVFTPQEIHQFVIAESPRTLLAKKSLEHNQINNLTNMFKSEHTLRGSIFFGALFDHLRKDSVSFAVNLIKAFHRDQVMVKEETIVFRLIKISPVSIARKLLGKAKDAFAEGRLKLPDFGQQD